MIKFIISQYSMHWARYCVLHPPPLNKQDLSKIFQSIQWEHKYCNTKKYFYNSENQVSKMVSGEPRRKRKK